MGGGGGRGGERQAKTILTVRAERIPFPRNYLVIPSHFANKETVDHKSPQSHTVTSGILGSGLLPQEGTLPTYPHPKLPSTVEKHCTGHHTTGQFTPKSLPSGHSRGIFSWLIFLHSLRSGWQKGVSRTQGNSVPRKPVVETLSWLSPAPHIPALFLLFAHPPLHFLFSGFIWAVCLLGCLLRSWALFAKPLFISYYLGYFQQLLWVFRRISSGRSNTGCKGKHIPDP